MNLYIDIIFEVLIILGIFYYVLFKNVKNYTNKATTSKIIILNNITENRHIWKIPEDINVNSPLFIWNNGVRYWEGEQYEIDKEKRLLKFKFSLDERRDVPRIEYFDI